MVLRVGRELNLRFCKDTNMEIFKLVKYIFVGSLPSVRNENKKWGKIPPLSLLQVAYDRT